MTFLSGEFGPQLRLSDGLSSSPVRLHLVESLPAGLARPEAEAPGVTLAPVPPSRSRRPLLVACFALFIVATLAIGTAIKTYAGRSATAARPATASLFAAASVEQSAGKIAAARADYNAVLKLDPANKFALFDLGVLDESQGQAVSAYYDYTKVLLVDPNYVPALFNLAIIESSTAPMTAVSLYQRIEQVDHQNAKAMFNLGVLYDNLGLKAQAIAQFNRAVHIQPSLSQSVPAGF